MKHKVQIIYGIYYDTDFDYYGFRISANEIVYIGQTTDLKKRFSVRLTDSQLDLQEINQLLRFNSKFKVITLMEIKSDDNIDSEFAKGIANIAELKLIKKEKPIMNIMGNKKRGQ